LRKLLATLAVVSLLAALAVVAATASGAGDARTAKSGTIRLKDNRFADGSLDIKKGKVNVNSGDRITFVWTGDNTHDVTGIRGGDTKFMSEQTDETGFEYRKTFKKDTTIFCSVHPTTMRFRVNVR
jgi:plastocyanin